MEDARDAAADAPAGTAVGLDGPPAGRPWRALYREVGMRHRRRVLGAAAELTAAHLEEDALLAALEARLPEWRAAALLDLP